MERIKKTVETTGQSIITTVTYKNSIRIMVEHETLPTEVYFWNLNDLKTLSRVKI